MPPLVVNSAMLSCTMGLGPPVPLTVVPKGAPVTAGGQLVATIADTLPMANIPMFGMCCVAREPGCHRRDRGGPRRPDPDALRARPGRPVGAWLGEGHAGRGPGADRGLGLPVRLGGDDLDRGARPGHGERQRLTSAVPRAGSGRASGRPRTGSGHETGPGRRAGREPGRCPCRQLRRRRPPRRPRRSSDPGLTPSRTPLTSEASLPNARAGAELAAPRTIGIPSLIALR